jgi:nucleoside-diphosphate-sugar epimerase
LKKLIAITGATGFIGQKLLAAHLTNGEKVRYMTRNNKLIDGAEAFIADVNDISEKLLPFFDKLNTLYHCIGELDNESAMRGTHVYGTQNLLNLLEKSHLQCKEDFHWIQLSSCGAYGQPNLHPSIVRYIDESTHDNPKGEYESTKSESDNLIMDFAKKHNWFKYTIIRPTIVFGVGMRSTAIIRIAQTIKKNLFFYVGNKNTISNFVHVDDVVNAMLLAVKNPHAYNQTFIVSNDCKFSDVIDTIADCLQISKPTWVVNEFVLRKLVGLIGGVIKLPINNAQIDVMVRQTYYSNQKIKSQLNWNPNTNVLSQLQTYVKNTFL